MKEKFIQRLRSAGIDLWSRLMSLNERVFYTDPENEVCWRDEARWWVDGKLSRLFGLAYFGSEEELDAAAREEIPWEHMTDRQQAYWREVNPGCVHPDDNHGIAKHRYQQRGPRALITHHASHHENHTMKITP